MGALVRAFVRMTTRRDWKITLVESVNPAWVNLWSTIVGSEDGSRLSPG